METIIITGLYSGVVASLAFLIAFLLRSQHAQIQPETVRVQQTQRPVSGHRPYCRTGLTIDSAPDPYSIVVIDLANDQIRLLQEIKNCS